MNAKLSFIDELRAERANYITRRWFFRQCGVGLGSIALASLLDPGKVFGGEKMAVASNPLAPRQPHFKPKAKRVIYLFMGGAPSQLDLFDYKPTLAKYNGRPVPKEVVMGQKYAFIKPDAALFASEFKFARHGQCGAELSEALPHLAEVVDDIAIVKSMTTDAFNHAPGQVLMQTGATQFGRPSMGSWVLYGLGSESQNLPGFVVLNSAGGLSGGAALYGGGFLPTVYQGVPFRKSGDPVLFLSNPAGVTNQMQRRTLDLVKDLNERHLRVMGDPEIATRINSFEMAFRMQSSAPELMDVSKESSETLKRYGAEPGKPSFAMNCLLARRLIERGVRFVQLFHEGWDHHSEVVKGIKDQTGKTDQASAALIKDLAQRGLLEETLVIWGGEFGRTPMVEANADFGRKWGRDHHPQAFTIWLAGGGIKPGITIGETDELGFHVVKDKVHVHDLHATILHLLGFDHTKLTFRFQGRDFRLTDVAGEVVEKLLA
ncbi:MAG: sulfatase [Verrucomicrobia bacterium]|nr:MAG: sulfatase [Verrucomicrobiota bacterium]